MKVSKVKVMILLVSILVIAAGKTNAKIRQGKINSKEDLVFLDNFLYANQGGDFLRYEIRYPAEECCYRLVFFDDSASQWTAIRPNEDLVTCSQKLDRVMDSKFNVKLSGKDDICYDFELTEDGSKWFVCRGLVDFSNQSKARWWFFHLANCPNNRNRPGLWNVSYFLHMTNGDNVSWREFSADEKYMIEVDVVFLLAFIITCVIATKYRFSLSKRKLLHLTYRLFYTSLVLETFSLFLHSIGSIDFARTGKPLTSTLDAAEIFSCLSSILFVILLLLIAKGFSVTRTRISLGGTIKVTVAALIYTAAYIVVFVYQNVLLDPRDVIFSQETKAASGIIGIKIAGFIWMVYGVFFTVKDHPRKAVFYIPFAVFFGVWFLAEPVTILLASFTCPVMRNTNISHGIQLTMSFLGHAYFLYLTRPDSFNQRFPFHLPANKISTRNSTDDDTDEPYLPPDDLYSIFLVESARAEAQTTERTTDDHFETPVMPFIPEPEFEIENRLAHWLPPATSPTIRTVSAMVNAHGYTSPPTHNYIDTDVPHHVPSVHRPPPIATTSCRGPLQELVTATCTQAEPTPIISADVAYSVEKAESVAASGRPLDDSLGTPLCAPDDSTVGPSTSKIRSPKGGFGIFCVEKPKTIQDAWTTEPTQLISRSKTKTSGPSEPEPVHETPDTQSLPFDLQNGPTKTGNITSPGASDDNESPAIENLKLSPAERKLPENLEVRVVDPPKHHMKTYGFDEDPGYGLPVGQEIIVPGCDEVLTNVASVCGDRPKKKRKEPSCRRFPRPREPNPNVELITPEIYAQNENEEATKSPDVNKTKKQRNKKTKLQAARNHHPASIPNRRINSAHVTAVAPM